MAEELNEAPSGAEEEQSERAVPNEEVAEGFANGGFSEGSEMDFQVRDPTPLPSVSNGGCGSTAVPFDRLCPAADQKQEGLRINQVVYLELTKITSPQEWKGDEKKAHESLVVIGMKECSEPFRFPLDQFSERLMGAAAAAQRCFEEEKLAKQAVNVTLSWTRPQVRPEELQKRLSRAQLLSFERTLETKAAVADFVEAWEEDTPVQAKVAHDNVAQFCARGRVLDVAVREDEWGSMNATVRKDPVAKILRVLMGMGEDDVRPAGRLTGNEGGAGQRLNEDQRVAHQLFLDDEQCVNCGQGGTEKSSRKSSGRRFVGPQKVWILPISKELIAESFLACGMTKEIDGQHDKQIHVFKPHGAIPNGLAILQQRREEAAVLRGVEEIDLGEDDQSDLSIDTTLNDDHQHVDC
uniref:Uncharacterized protein n=1 Tax=Globodera rostochiensis TaxID=31243 RepID=A0A914IA14_GLORO